MRIGIVAPPWIAVPPPTYGGTEVVVDALARGFAAAGHDVVLCATGDSTCPVPLTSYWAQAYAPLGNVLAETAHVLHAYDALRDCDVVHDHTLVGPLLVTRHPAGAPVVTTTHGPLDGDLAPLFRAMAERVAVVAISHAQRASAPDVPVTRVIHHGVQVDEIPVGDGDGGYVLFLGRMTPDKGVHLAIDAARRAGVPIVLAAKMREDSERAYFEEFVRPRLGPGADYVGEVGGEERWRLLGGARALVNPIRWPEPFGLVMVEALTCGTPVVAFPLGAAPEIVDDGKTGFLCADDDALASAVTSAGELDRASCRQAVEERFSADRMVAEHLDLYADLLAR